jgi:sulfate adenylyltransferase
MHLSNGLVWSLPITLSVSEEEAGDISVGEEIALADGTGACSRPMTVEDRYSYDKEREAREVFGTTSDEHPAWPPSTARRTCSWAGRSRSW